MTSVAIDLKAYLSNHREQVEQALALHLDRDDRRSRLAAAMRYSVMAGGKRLRPILCIAAAEAIGGDARQVMPVAVALEMIHTYSLIHDDLPAMDDDATRRGQATCHIEFDESTAILAGDALLTLAFEILGQAAGKAPPDEMGRWPQVMAQVAAAAGYRGMIEGQMRDMAFEGKTIAQEELEAMHRLKTGRMIEVSVVTGAMLAGASQQQQASLGAYARQIGLAFQVADDILNVKGDPRQLGKATGSDLARGKNTYPALMGLPAAEDLARQLVNKSLKALDSFDRKANPLRAIAHYVVQRKR